MKDFIEKNRYILILLSSIILLSISILIFIVVSTNKPNFIIEELGEIYLSQEDYIDQSFKLLTKEEQQGLMMMVGIPDIVLSESTISYLKDNHIGGIILMGYNVESQEQVTKLISELREKVDPNILIGIDQEGGTVVRIGWDEYAEISARELGEKNDPSKAQEIAESRGELLKELGVDITFGPVADIGYTKSDFIYDRSFGSTPEVVAKFVRATQIGYNEAGIINSPKHFPGHGRTSVDSHTSLPTINLSKTVLQNEEWVPFKAAIEEGVKMIMLAHVINPNISDRPASIDPIYRDILEEELGFTGVIITDDLNMAGGIEGSINYGINLTLEPQEKVLERMRSLEPEEEYVKRILQLRMEN